MTCLANPFQGMQMRVDRAGDLVGLGSISLPGAGGALGSPVQGELAPHVGDNQAGALVAGDDLFPRRSINTDYVSVVSGSFLAEATQSKRNWRQWSNGASPCSRRAHWSKPAPAGTRGCQTPAQSAGRNSSERNRQERGITLFPPQVVKLSKPKSPPHEFQMPSFCSSRC